MSSATPTESAAPATAPPQKRPVWIVFVVLFVVIGYFGVKAWLYNSTHVTTDDAQVTANLVQVAPKVGGTVVKVLVEDNQLVKGGDLIAELDPATFQSAVTQAEANLALAEAQTKQAVASVGLTGDISDAQLQQAQGQLDQTEGAVAGSLADVDRYKAAISAAKAQASGAKSTILSAEAGLKAATANLNKANDGVKQAESQVVSAQADAKAADAGVEAATATRQMDERDFQRLQTLLQEGVISAQTAERSGTQLKVAIAQEKAARDKAHSAQSLVDQRRQEVATAHSQVDAASAAVTQAKSLIQTSSDQAAASSAVVEQANAQLQAAHTAVLQARGRSRQANGALAQARTAPVQVEITKVQNEQADAKVKQAQAALDDARLKLGWTKIYAPASGRISKKAVTVGAQVQVGSPLLAIVPTNSAWVIANFKETQVGDLKVGQPAEIDFDAFSGEPLKGHVDSLSAGTGATFALLPPDNATGNYTKVVQRVPVKIVFEPGQSGLDKIRVGLSVNVSVSMKEK